MKGKVLLLLITLILLSFQIVSALEITSYKITATPIHGNSVENIIELTLQNNKEEPLTSGTLNFAADAEVESISDSFGDVSFSSIIEGEKQKVQFQFSKPVDVGEARVLTIKTTTYNIVQKEGYFEYLLVIVPSKDIDSFTHTLKLPSDVVLDENGEESSIIVPDATITGTEQYTFIEWNVALQKDLPAVFLARFDQRNVNWWKWFGMVMLFIGLGILMGFCGNKLYTYRKQKKALHMTNILNLREKAVLDEVIRNPCIKQYELVKKLGYTKSNMSKILKRLELRELIKIKKEGKVRILTVGEKLERQL